MGSEEPQPIGTETTVYLGNRNAVEASYDHDAGAMVTSVMPYGKRCTTIRIPGDRTLMEAATEITHSRGVWAAHAESGATPAWVASTNPGLALVLGSHFKCEIREPEPDHVAPGSEG